jgi:hypothetical protein
VLVPFESPVAIAAAAIELLENDAKRQAMRKRAYLYARKMVWYRVAQSYMHSFVRTRVDSIQPTRFGVSAQVAEKNASSQRPNTYAEV